MNKFAIAVSLAALGLGTYFFVRQNKRRREINPDNKTKRFIDSKGSLVKTGESNPDAIILKNRTLLVPPVIDPGNGNENIVPKKVYSPGSPSIIQPATNPIYSNPVIQEVPVQTEYQWKVPIIQPETNPIYSNPVIQEVPVQTEYQFKVPIIQPTTNLIYSSPVEPRDEVTLPYSYEQYRSGGARVRGQFFDQELANDTPALMGFSQLLR